MYRPTCWKEIVASRVPVRIETKAVTLRLTADDDGRLQESMDEQLATLNLKFAGRLMKDRVKIDFVETVAGRPPLERTLEIKQNVIEFGLTLKYEIRHCPDLLTLNVQAEGRLRFRGSRFRFERVRFARQALL